MKFENVELEIQREPFVRPFSFKGSSFHEKWNLVVRLDDGAGNEAFGIGGLAVLWSDPEVFAAHTEIGGNVLQTSLLEFALQLVRGWEFDCPLTMHDEILPLVHAYGQKVTGNEDLRRTFTLISLVALDNAAWMLKANHDRIGNFDGLIPATFRPFLSHRQKHVAIVPAVGYNLPEETLRQMLDGGVYILKVKIGQPGAESEMVEKDIERMQDVHQIASSYATDMTDSGRIFYYLDSNGRYGEKESLLRLIDAGEKDGWLEQLLLIEEPFDEAVRPDVTDIPVCLAADESLHCIEDVRIRKQEGYRAIAIKPAGKTLSLGFRMAQAAAEEEMIPFVADNACVPILVDWNKNVAARLPSFPGVKGGILESNGPENYGTWQQMLDSHPCAGASWLQPKRGAFVLDEDYYQQSGGVFEPPTPYISLFRNS